MKTKRNTHARIDQYLLHIGKPEFLLKDVDKEFCKGFITFLKTCTYNDGKNNSAPPLASYVRQLFRLVIGKGSKGRTD